MAYSPSVTKFPGRYATSSAQLYPRDARTRVRHLGLSTLAAMSDLRGHLRSALKRPRVQILLLHHVLEDEQVPFRTLLRELSRDHTFITYSDALQRIQSGAIDEPYVALTFDDGQRSGLRATQIMLEFGVTACFFVCPAMIGVTDYQRIRRFCTERLEIPPVPFMSWSDLERLRREGHEIGSHTIDHPNLAELPVEELQEQIEGSREQLSQRLGPVEHFAWPYGGLEHFSGEAARIVFRSGYTSCASGVRGAHGPRSEPRDGPACVRRDHVIAAWPVRHCMYLAAANSDHLAEADGEWPEAWGPIES